MGRRFRLSIPWTSGRAPRIVAANREGTMRTQVGIVGAGPAGLMLSHLLHLAGISSIVIEDRSRAYCEARVRAGLMENWVAQMLIDTGVGERLQARGHGARRHLHLVQGRGAAHRLPQADRQAGLHLRPEGGRHRPDRQAAGRRRADFLRGRGHQRPRFRRRQSENPLPPPGQGAGDRMRFHRRLRRLPRRLPAELSGRRAARTTTASIRSAGSASCRNRRRRTTS